MTDENRTAYISLGSNLGETTANLQQGRRKLCALPGIAMVDASSVYMTEPQGVRDQPWFANQVVMIACSPDWTPWKLLGTLLGIESSLGRVRITRWGPRMIDLDLLLFAAETSNEPWLTLPHPRMEQRGFVMVPLLEIAPHLVLPSGKTVGEVVEGLACSIEGNIIRQDG
ncbi:2-amino-4-hydroxy-6-hydroxymethyldihydropteridine diphosphokinase [Desulfoplanes sp.]